jgi:hypothetical protein
MKRKRESGSYNEPLFKKAKYDNILDEIVNYKTDYNEVKIIPKLIKRNPLKNIMIKFTGRNNQYNAIRVRNKKYKGCQIFGEEIIQNTDERFFHHLIISLDVLVKILEKCSYPRFHECIEGASKLSFDIDIDEENLNKTINQDVYKEIFKKLHNLILFINKNIKKEFKIDINYLPNKPLRSDVKILDGSRNKKISFHVIYKNVIFLNITQVGIYLSKVFNMLMERKCDYIDILKFVDFNIYKSGHMLRTYFCVKGSDTSSRLILMGLNKQQFNEQILNDTLINNFEQEKINCITIENVSSLFDSFHYTKYNNRINNLNNNKKQIKTKIKKRRCMSIVSRTQERDFDTNDDVIKNLYDIFNEIFKKNDNKFDCSDYQIQRVFLSNFGSQPFRIPSSGITIIKGQSLCIEIYGKYCPKHLKYHDNALTKTYYYFPFSDEIFNKKRKYNSRNKKEIKIKENHKYIFNLYYRCNFRESNASCLKIELVKIYPGIVNRFVEVHKKILRLIK